MGDRPRPRGSGSLNVCGIAGLVDLRADAGRWIEGMTTAQSHRGPDGHGVWASELAEIGRIHLGHRRLAILDLSEAGAQPMTDATGQYVITYNGEIYNYLEVRQDLARQGVSFRSASDTEVILEAYKRWGASCLDRFNGMFAFALYDRPRGRLFCARDRYGEKPFLFSHGKDFFAWASEYKALLLHPLVSVEYDEGRLLQAAYNPGTGLDADRQTVFTNIEQLLPGEAMELDLRGLQPRIWKYWQVQPRGEAPAVNEADVFDTFRELLTDAVRLRLRSDVPVGSCLSGGLDSSAIVCLVRRLVGENTPYHTFTGRFPGTPADEWDYAQQVVQAAGTVSHVVEPTVEGFLDELSAFVWHNELPVGSSSQYAQWSVFRLAREHGVTVLLDGQGADESLGGYEQYFARYVEALRERGDTARLDREISVIRCRYPLALTPPARAWRDRLPLGVRHWLSNRFGIGTSLLYGVRPDVARRLQADAAPERIPGFDPLASALLQDTFGRFLTTLLRYGDRNSMAHSREVRLPFCDHRIAEFVFRLPPHLLMGEVQTKRLLRESMRGILPEPVRTRWNKQGFRPPQDLWFRSPRMLRLMRETLDDPMFGDEGRWLRTWWERAVARVERGESHLAWVLWQPMMVAAWRRHFIGRVDAERAIAAQAA